MVSAIITLRSVYRHLMFKFTEEEMAELKIVLFLLMCTMLFGSPAVEAAGYPNVSLVIRPDCSPVCGNVTIPYPYGIGSGCFLDEWYQILCKNNTTPWLKKLNLRVLNISYYGLTPFSSSSLIMVSYPIVYSPRCAQNNNTIEQPLSLTGSPFTFSSDNAFVAVGCNSVAIMDMNSNSSFVGCKTHCTGTSPRRISSCDGSDCCQSMIPDSYLQELHVDLRLGGNSSETTSTGDGDCQYGFLAAIDWFEPSKTDFYALQNGDYVPVVLKWGIFNASLPESLRLQVDGSLSSDIPAACNTFTYVNKNTTRLIECYCNYGFMGNPFLLDGCQDIDECELPEGERVCGQLKCKNEVGNFMCLIPKGKGSSTSTIIGLSSSFGSLLLIFLSWRFYKLIKKRRDAKRREKFFKRNGGLMLQRQLSVPGANVEKSKLFDSKELEKSTDHFNKDRILGKGGQGTVYKGMLTDGRIIAVKKSASIDEKDVEPFINEVVILSQINHRNIVKLLGCCLECEVPLLVYEFIPNGTLYQYLHDPEFPVSWEVRLRIATEVASALFYLHSSASIPIFHRDIKSSNILLDGKHRAKIADFGTSRSVAIDQTHMTTLVQGTFGYLDPEYFRSGQFTEKSDVYSFGVVLVELLTGERPTTSLLGDNCIGLASSFVIAMEDGRLFEVIDPRVRKEGGNEEIAVVANVAKRCLNLKGRKRPSMKEIVIELEGIRNQSQSATNQPLHTEEVGQDDLYELEADDDISIFRVPEVECSTLSFSSSYPFLTDDTL